MEPRQADSRHGRPSEVFWTFLKIGLIAFGGPIAHLGYFEREIVERRKWLPQEAFGDLVALGQFLPGPASSQVAFALGYQRAGIRGAFAATAGFTMPSAVLMIAIAYGFQAINTQSGFLHGLKLAAVAIVAQAVWTMAVKLCPDRERVTLAIAAACVVLGVLHCLATGGCTCGWRIVRMDIFAGQTQTRRNQARRKESAWRLVCLGQHRSLFCPFGRPSSAMRFIPGSLASVSRCFLPFGGAGFRRGSRSLAFVTIPNSVSRLAKSAHLHGRLRGCTSHAGTTVRFFSLPWNSHWTQLVRRIVVPCMDLSSLFSVASRCAAVLE